jgi:hypothetical protein
MSLEDGICPICQQGMDAYVSFANEPFVDGKKYDGICQICAECIVWTDPPQLRVLEMVATESSGYDPRLVKICLKSIKKLAQKRKIKLKEYKPPKPEPIPEIEPKPEEPPKPKKKIRKIA